MDVGCGFVSKAPVDPWKLGQVEHGAGHVTNGPIEWFGLPVFLRMIR
jgi:hypothetical protein